MKDVNVTHALEDAGTVARRKSYIVRYAHHVVDLFGFPQNEEELAALFACFAADMESAVLGNYDELRKKMEPGVLVRIYGQVLARGLKTSITVANDLSNPMAERKALREGEKTT